MEPLALAPPIPRFQTPFRSRPWLADALGAVLVGGIGVVSKPSISVATSMQAGYSVIVLGCCASMVFRRSHPRFALLIVALFLIVHLVLVDELSIFAGVICLIAAYTTQTQLPPPWRWGFLALTYAGTILGIISASGPALGTTWHSRAVVVAAVCAAISVAALVGVLRRHTRDRYDLAVERAAVLQAHQDGERRLAAAEGRNRVARDMHDILGHSLNAVAVQAEGARYVLRADPDRADQALADIGRLSRTAVEDVRSLIDVLRTEDEAVIIHSPPMLRAIPALIGALQPTGTTIRLHLDGDVDALPDRVSQTAYRIVQEALTNAIKHGPAPVTVRLTMVTGSLDLLITNSATPPTATAQPAGRGHGLIGMDERVRALGGTLDVGPSSTGGWHVAAHLPWSRP